MRTRFDRTPAPRGASNERSYRRRVHAARCPPGFTVDIPVRATINCISATGRRLSGSARTHKSFPFTFHTEAVERTACHSVCRRRGRGRRKHGSNFHGVHHAIVSAVRARTHSEGSPSEPRSADLRRGDGRTPWSTLSLTQEGRPSCRVTADPCQVTNPRVLPCIRVERLKVRVTASNIDVRIRGLLRRQSAIIARHDRHQATAADNVRMPSQGWRTHRAHPYSTLR